MRELDVGARPAGDDEVVRLPEGDGARQLLTRDDPHGRPAGGGLHRRLDQGRGDAHALGRGRHAEPPEHQPVGHRVEDGAADGAVVEDGEQPSATGQQPPDRVEVLPERVCRRVQGGARAERLLHDRQDVGGRLGTHPAYDEAHSRPCPWASEIRSSSSAVTSLCFSSSTM